MRLGALVLLGACGAAPVAPPTPAAVGPAAPPASPATSDTSVAVDHLGAPPEDTDVHLHAPPMYVADLDRLYVEVTSLGEHAAVLRESATAGLADVPNTVAVDDGADVELHVEVASLTPEADGAACQLKIFVMRLPQHDLLAIADGRGRAMGQGADDACLSTMSTTIVKQKLPPLLERQLEFKR